MINQEQHYFDTDINGYLTAIPNELKWQPDDQKTMSESSEADTDSSVDYTNPASDAKLLVISDESINAEMIHDFLGAYGYKKVSFSHDITQAFEIIFHEQPDAILYETNTLSSAAFNTLERIKGNIKTSLVPLLILSAEDDENTKLKALELGAVDMIAKPASEKELALRLRNILSVKTYHDQIANYDNLTKLPNLQTFMSRLEWCIKHAKRHKAIGAALQIRIIGLDKINDAYGMSVVDQVIKSIATRIKITIRDTDSVTRANHQDMESTISRSSGNEFSVLLPQILRSEDAAIVIRRIHKKLKLVYKIDNRQLYIDCKTGISIFPDDGNNHETILNAAVMALHQTEADSNTNYLFYSSELNQRSQYRVTMENNLRKALDQQEFEVYYQPKMSLLTKKIIGAEALIRWNHPELGFISPEEFIPVAEQTGMINRLGDWLIDAITNQIIDWKSKEINVPRISINISSLQFKNKSIVKTIEKTLLDKHLDGNLLTIELTETTMMENTQLMVDALNRLKSLGIKISIDDFGTGFSSLVQLKELPLDEVKIDRSFTWDIGSNNNTEAIITAIIAMAKRLNLTTVAEGVETDEQLAFLMQHGCDEYQGYLFSPAVSPDEFGKIID